MRESERSPTTPCSEASARSDTDGLHSEGYPKAKLRGADNAFLRDNRAINRTITSHLNLPFWETMSPLLVRDEAPLST